MGNVQLIFVLETNKQCDSDWLYIKEAIRHYYVIDNTSVKLSVVYMESKTRFNHRKVLKEIENLKRKYSYGKSVVIYCVDTDKYMSDPNDLALTNKIKDFCTDNQFEFVFFREDIKQVFLDKSVSSNTKKKEAVSFVRNGSINDISRNKFLSNKMLRGHSNLFSVIDSINALSLKD